VIVSIVARKSQDTKKVNPALSEPLCDPDFTPRTERLRYLELSLIRDAAADDRWRM
jgi:hypothetical protein